MSKLECHCKKCALCCHDTALISNSIVINIDSYCEHYDIKTKTCKIYATRLIDSVRDNKSTVSKSVFDSYLPPTYDYVAWAKLKHIQFSSIRMLRLIHSKQLSGEDDSENYLYQCL